MIHAASSRADTAVKRGLAGKIFRNGVQYARIGDDSFYGRDTGFLCWIEDSGAGFYADTPEKTNVWLTKLKGDNRPASPVKHGAIKVSDLTSIESSWKKSKRIKIRDGEMALSRSTAWSAVCGYGPLKTRGHASEVEIERYRNAVCTANYPICMHPLKVVFSDNQRCGYLSHATSDYDKGRMAMPTLLPVFDPATGSSNGLDS